MPAARMAEIVGPAAWEPVVDRDTWERAQKVAIPRGRRAKSFRLLARQGVLRCASCGARMVVGNSRPGGSGFVWAYSYECGLSQPMACLARRLFRTYFMHTARLVNPIRRFALEAPGMSVNRTDQIYRF